MLRHASETTPARRERSRPAGTWSRRTARGRQATCGLARPRPASRGGFGLLALLAPVALEAAVRLPERRGELPLVATLADALLESCALGVDELLLRSAVAHSLCPGGEHVAHQPE